MSLLSLGQSLIDTFELRILLDLGDGAVERRAVAFVLPVRHILGHFVGVSHPSPSKVFRLGRARTANECCFRYLTVRPETCRRVNGCLSHNLAMITAQVAWAGPVSGQMPAPCHAAAVSFV